MRTALKTYTQDVQDYICDAVFQQRQDVSAEFDRTIDLFTASATKIQSNRSMDSCSLGTGDTSTHVYVQGTTGAHYVWNPVPIPVPPLVVSSGVIEYYVYTDEDDVVVSPEFSNARKRHFRCTLNTVGVLRAVTIEI